MYDKSAKIDPILFLILLEGYKSNNYNLNIFSNFYCSESLSSWVTYHDEIPVSALLFYRARD